MEGTMKQGWLKALALGVACMWPAGVQAAGWGFHWKIGQSLTYRVEQTTSVAEVVEGKKAETKSKLNTTKKWQVLAVDEGGLATLQLTLTELRIETTSPAGEVILFDSNHQDKSDAQMREQMAKYLGQAVAVLRINEQGHVVEVKQCKFGAPSRFESEPPFVLTFPEDGVRAAWERSYKITLEPPQGTGEKFHAVQKYNCRKVEGSVATVALTTTLVSPPAAVAEQIPLLQSQPQGEILFDYQTGILQSAKLQVDKELKGHQGEGSTYRFQSSYTETYEP
jgi:hypothetical protein